jgi:hypothetical protein
LDIEALRISVIVIVFLQSCSAAIVAALLTHLKLPRISPWAGFAAVLSLGLVTTFLSLKVVSNYELATDAVGTFSLVIGFSTIGILYSVLRMVIIVGTFFPLMAIVFQQAMETREPTLRRRSFGLVFALFLGIMLGLFDFILQNILGVQAGIYRDYISITIGISLFLIVLFTQKPVPKTAP